VYTSWRAIWTAIHRLLGKEGRIRMFGSHEQALEWVREGEKVALS
jgi:hypothetical protein